MTLREAEKERNKDIIIKILCEEIDRKDRHIARLERDIEVLEEVRCKKC